MFECFSNATILTMFLWFMVGMVCITIGTIRFNQDGRFNHWLTIGCTIFLIEPVFTVIIG